MDGLLRSKSVFSIVNQGLLNVLESNDVIKLAIKFIFQVLVFLLTDYIYAK